MKFVRLSVIPLLLIFQYACQSYVDASPSTSKPSPQKTRVTGHEYETYEQEVRKHWANNDYEWLENESRKLTVSKERLPGGYWKLRICIEALKRQLTMNLQTHRGENTSRE